MYRDCKIGGSVRCGVSAAVLAQMGLGIGRHARVGASDWIGGRIASSSGIEKQRESQEMVCSAGPSVNARVVWAMGGGRRDLRDAIFR